MRFSDNKHVNIARLAVRSVVLLVCLCATHAVMAQSSIAIFAPADDLALRTAKDVQILLTERNVESSLFSDLSELKDGLSADQRLLVLGDEACRSVSITIKNTDVLCGLISHHYQPGDISLQRVSYMPLEVPAPYFVALAKRLVPDIANMGIVLGPLAQHRASFYQELANSYGFEPRLCLLDEGANPMKALDASMRVSDVFVVLPDEVIFNRATAPWILQLAMRYRIPVLAYSENYVHAGALAALFQSRQDLAQNLVNALTEKSAKLAFSLALNSAVASNLGIVLDSEDAYLLAVQEAER